MTYNIRYATVNDGENQWENRKEDVLDLIRDQSPGIFGLQEALYEQTTFLANHLLGYDHIGVGRDDGQEKGEMVPVFFDTAKYQLLESGHFWLSETPDVPSSGWDANLNRLVTWGKFKIKESGRKLIVINTHLDHQGEEARKNSSLLILNWIAKNWIEFPLILMGDFNSTPESEPYQILNSSKWASDSFSGVLNPDKKGTFSGGFHIDNRINDRIDHIFISTHIQVIGHQFDIRNRNGFFPSDHIPVILEFILEK